MNDAPFGEIDGRHARRDRNRSQVIEAVMAFLTEGEAFPTLLQIAQRAGLSLRSVHRYFDDGDAAVVAAVMAFQERNREIITLPPVGPDATTADRVALWVDYAIHIQEVGSTALLAAMARADRSTAVGEAVEAGRQLTLDQMRALFEPDLAALGDADRTTAVAGSTP